MDSIAENSDKNKVYRHDLRNHLFGDERNPENLKKFREACVAEFCKRSPHLKPEICRTPQLNSDVEEHFYARQKNINTAVSGGDADRTLYCVMNADHHMDPYCRCHNHDNISCKHIQSISQSFAPSSLKYETSGFPDCSGDHNYRFENHSSLRGVGNNTEDSGNSQKSSKTVVSRKSSRYLKKLVKSQCKFHEVVGKTLKEMCNTEAEPLDIHNSYGVQEDPPHLYPIPLSECKRCSERLNSNPSQGELVTEIEKSDIFDCRNINTLNISVDDMINSKVIIPIIQKLHRMYLNNLKEEMSLMEDLEGLPNKINEVYKSSVFKPKD